MLNQPDGPPSSRRPAVVPCRSRDAEQVAPNREDRRPQLPVLRLKRVRWIELSQPSLVPAHPLPGLTTRTTGYR
jgi:hypothetical protein